MTPESEIEPDKTKPGDPRSEVSGFGKSALLLVAGFAMGALFTVVMLNAGNKPAPRPPVQPEPIYSLAPTASGSAATSREWISISDKNKIDGSTMELMSMRSTEGGQSLLVRCENSKVEVFIDIGEQLETESEGGNDVRIKFDSDSPVRQRWSHSTRGTAVFSPSPSKFLAKAKASKTLLFEYTPFESRPQTATFYLDGLADKMASAEACRAIK